MSILQIVCSILNAVVPSGETAFWLQLDVAFHGSLQFLTLLAQS